MDEQLRQLIGDGPDRKAVIEFSDPATGEIRVLPSTDAAADESAGQRHTLKPLPELYGTGTGLDSVALTDDRFLSLLLAIEQAIIDFAKAQGGLTDAAVTIALDRLCMAPEADVRNDPLALSIQAGLRLALSLSDFSRQDVRHCLRKVKQSVARHSRLSGTRGYLTFIRQQLRQ